MFDKFYVNVSTAKAYAAANAFLSNLEVLERWMDQTTMTKMITFCDECITLHENREHLEPQITDTFTMTNTQAVWVYSWCDEVKVAHSLAEHRKAEYRKTT